MHFLELFLFIILNSFVVDCQLATNDVEGCHWRDYRGKIPNDAVQAGINDYGKKIYIGQAVHSQKKLMPGKIVEGHNSMSYVWGDGKNEFVVTEAIKILCTHHPENIKWTEVDSSKLQVLSPVEFVLGGYDSVDLYIGRTSSEGHTGVGKITIREQDTFGYSEENGTAVWTDSGYEVLSYTVGNENKPPSANHTIHSNGKVINIHIYK